MDTTELGNIAAEMMEALAEDFGDGAELGVVMVVAEVVDDTDPDDQLNTIVGRCSDGREWVQTGLLQTATRTIRNFDGISDEEDE